jgi:flagellin-specific chaperone FliS
MSKKIKLFDELKVQKNRYSFGNFSDNLEKFYNRRIKSLKQRGFL